ncbi:TraB/GumN family protein [Heliorestis acidaminivorans]|uniref:TraB/GumN family protein n=1 Tax=Heliorestis acidaminivorans TaxID=553427 RepID=A0A6I0EWV7_9FIRM|nr:TraB/GumN family protein [Heliorestis acidaminivorans]KAB2954289.1 TraB/GumN family protein [Heliorestis acidaminivorans]
MTNSNVHRIEIEGKEVLLIGTAHVSPKSVEEVKEVIEQERPDSVCVELCHSRYQSITDADRWKKMDVIKIIKNGQAMMLLSNLILASHQKRLARKFGIKPGQEMIQGIESAKEVGASLCLADRDIQTTMLRLWRPLTFINKVQLFISLLASLFANDDITEEELDKMKGQDMLTSILDEIGQSFPHLKTTIIDERDQYLAHKIKTASGNKVVAVLGAAHVPGIKKELMKDHNLDELTKLPPASNTGKILGWGIPLFILAIIISTFSIDQATGIDQLTSWILWNGSLAALGTLIALGHPLSILVAFLAAPISSLSPLLAAGWFAGITEAMLRKPQVKDFENISDDVYSVKGFWQNKVTRILLVVVLANIGSSLGTIIGGADVVRQFLNTVF